MKFTVHEAAVHTAAVEIRTLTISGKQVTLAVFRQLEAEDLFDQNLGLKGIPWGWVNYHPSKDCWRINVEDWSGGLTPVGRGQHLHVVWQKGNELRQCAVYEDWKDHGDIQGKYLERWPEGASSMNQHQYQQWWRDYQSSAPFKLLKATYHQQYQALAQLPQLFIAV